MKTDIPFAKIALASALCLAAARADVVRHPLNSGAALEYGAIYHSGNLVSGQFPIDKSTVKRTIGWFLQSATIDERMDLVAGVGGVFLYLYPDEGYAYQHSAISAVALIQASGAYTWGNLEDPAAKLSFGFLPYKYNPDAKNLGEYLFRSTPYPTTTTNGSWNLVNSSQAKIWGGVLSKNFFGGKWKNDLVMSVSDVYPLYDFSPAFVTSLRVNPVLEFGAGVNFYHLIQDNPKINTLKSPTNAHFNYQGKDYYAFSDYYKQAASLQKGADSLASEASAHLVDSLVPTGGVPALVPLDYYTVNGTLLSARFSLDMKPVLGEQVDLKLYGEASLLGVKNYPVFFEKAMNRVPLMVGLNIPTFGLLDQLGVEAEYWKNPYINSYFNVISQSALGAIPDYGHESSTSAGLGVDPTRDYTKDDWAWAVTAQKSVGKNFAVIVKAARDHLTQLNAGQGFGTDLQHDILPDNKGWYYIIHIQAAI
jgi:hypothetical protein